MSDYGLAHRIKRLESLGNSVYSIIVAKAKKKTIVISSAPERLFGAREIVQLTLLAICRVDFLFIRNPIGWMYRRTSYKVNRVRSIEFISGLISRILFLRSKKIVVEHESQKTFLMDQFSSHPLILSWPNRLSDVHPITAKPLANPSTSKLTIGMLGNLNHDKRDYSVFLQCLSDYFSKSEVIVIVLGGVRLVRGFHREMIEKFSRVSTLETCLPQDSWSESDFFYQGSRCHVLVSPLSLTWGFGSLWSSGSIADAIFLKRRLLLPEGIGLECQPSSFVNYYRDVESLGRLLKATPLSDFEISQPQFTSHIGSQLLLSNQQT
jgi:hypothetical protein